MSDPSLGLAPQDVTAILAFLQRYVPGAEVWAFGSRVRGTARPFSDLDLVIVNEEPIQGQTRAELNYALSESDLPIKVDLVEWAATSQAFRDIILKNHLVFKPKPS